MSLRVRWFSSPPSSIKYVALSNTSIFHFPIPIFRSHTIRFVINILISPYRSLSPPSCLTFDMLPFSTTPKAMSPYNLYHHSLPPLPLPLTPSISFSVSLSPSSSYHLSPHFLPYRLLFPTTPYLPPICYPSTTTTPITSYPFLNPFHYPLPCIHHKHTHLPSSSTPNWSKFVCMSLFAPLSLSLTSCNDDVACGFAGVQGWGCSFYSSLVS